MSGLLFLNSNDFYVASGTKGPILCTSIKGFSLILFYSNQCPHCQQILPVFRKLPGTIGGCQFGLLNVSSNKECIKKSKKTIVPIQYVPLIILYINGKPFMKYSGPLQENEIKTFILEVSNTVNNKQKFTNNKQVKEIVRGIPEYSIGHPLYGEDNITYLEFIEAYKDMKKKGNNRNMARSNNDARSIQQQMANAAFKNS